MKERCRVWIRIWERRWKLWDGWRMSGGMGRSGKADRRLICGLERHSVRVRPLRKLNICKLTRLNTSWKLSTYEHWIHSPEQRILAFKRMTVSPSHHPQAPADSYQPLAASSKGNLPNPAPGTRTLTDDLCVLALAPLLPGQKLKKRTIDHVPFVLAYRFVMSL